MFYPEPTGPEYPTFYGKELTADEQKQQAAFDVKQRAYDKKLQSYNRTASLITLVIAVVILSISLIFEKQLGLIADGLLLGGIFTLLYGVGRGMATDNSKYRFMVAGIGLAISLVLGYLKFTRREAKLAK